MSRRAALIPSLLLALAAVGCSGSDQGITIQPDDADPQINLASPALGSWVSSGETTLTGSYNDLSAVTANAADANLGDATWSSGAELERGVNLIEATGTGTNGDIVFQRGAVLAGTFSDPDGPVQDAFIARVNEAGLDQVLGLAGDLLDLSALTDDLSALNPVLEDTVEVLGYDLVEYSVDIDEMTFRDPIIRLDPRPGYLSVEVEIPYLFVDMTAFSDVTLFDFEVGVSMAADSVDVVADVFVDADNGELTVSIDGADVTMRGFSYDASLLPSWIESWLFVDTIRGTIEDLVVEQLNTLVPELIAGFLDDLPLTFELDLLGNPLTLEGTIADAFIDERGIQIAADMDVFIPGDAGLTHAGYLTSGVVNAPELSTTAPFSASLSDDTLNRLLFEVWKAGVLELEVDSEDPDLGLYIGLILDLLNADEGGIAVSAAMPPVLVASGDAFEAQAGELELTVLTPGGDLGESLTLSIAAFMGLELGLKDNCLELELGEPELGLMVRESDWGATNEATTKLMEEMLPMETILGAIDLLLGDGFCDLVPLEGFSLDEVTMERDAGGAHTLMEIEISMD